MKIDIFRNIDKNRFGEENVELMDKLADILNYNFTKLYNALNRNLTYGDNIKGSLKQVRVQVDSNGIPTIGNQFRLDIEGQIQGAIVRRALCVNNSNTFPISHPFISYTQNNNLVTINHISGLQANTLYDLSLELPGE